MLPLKKVSDWEIPYPTNISQSLAIIICNLEYKHIAYKLWYNQVTENVQGEYKEFK